jgi:hypothetical protein
VGFDNRINADHISCNHQILVKKWEYNETVHQLFIDITKAYDSLGREAVYSILIVSGVPLKIVRLIKIGLNETYNEVHIGKLSSGMFPIQNGLKQGNALLPFLLL